MSDELPLPNYDEMSLGDIQHKVRSLTRAEVETILTYEAGHAARVPVLEVVEARLHQLENGAEPAPGDPRRAPDIASTPGGSQVQESTAAEANTPLRHGVAGQTPKRGKP
ncbi:hypothetical protein [Mycolicibacterium goodii]|uniref:DUF8129 domain-containing protein n=1 Tax=Mycolicibacterium goodii TaxID=134601 RepID=A0ABS6HLA5_MYCGD|nr:hypothetical protein [Mycolicibacterium goodii]MBU8812561.1 hypothetical protein [Mycolicibacterium goodii]MBU8818824.1 hypothetical protein [Mycolicibacterium goodii]MBU8823472.1 hypothetical protein [Mycolicibacterium goodii]MBU8830125.1 hypothetical protein [Mycolicibacterium goodii]MBU8835479.1 hypothetical protein [Mycolicibacterium goodii]